jgi:hypothetical protein
MPSTNFSMDWVYMSINFWERNRYEPVVVHFFRK